VLIAWVLNVELRHLACGLTPAIMIPAWDRSQTRVLDVKVRLRLTTLTDLCTQKNGL